MHCRDIVDAAVTEREKDPDTPHVAAGLNFRSYSALNHLKMRRTGSPRSLAGGQRHLGALGLCSAGVGKTAVSNATSTASNVTKTACGNHDCTPHVRQDVCLAHCAAESASMAPLLPPSHPPLLWRLSKSDAGSWVPGFQENRGPCRGGS